MRTYCFKYTLYLVIIVFEQGWNAILNKYYYKKLILLYTKKSTIRFWRVFADISSDIKVGGTYNTVYPQFINFFFNAGIKCHLSTILLIFFYVISPLQFISKKFLSNIKVVGTINRAHSHFIQYFVIQGWYVIFNQF